MNKRFFSFLLALCMLLSFLPVYSFAAAAMPLIGSEDWVSSRGYLVTYYDELAEENVTSYFQYDIPKNGAAVIILYDADCKKSQQLFQTLDGASWLSSPYLNVMALECENHHGGDVSDFAHRYAPDAAENIHWMWNSNELAWKYGIAYFGSDCAVNVSYPFVLVVSEQGGQRLIHSGDINMTDINKLHASLCDASPAFAGVDNPDTPQGEVVTVGLAGERNRDKATQAFRLVNTTRSANGARQLSQNGTLTLLAERRAAELALYYDARRPDGTTYKTLFQDAYRGYTASAQLITHSLEEAQPVLDAWLANQADRANLLSPDYTQAGVGCFYSNGKYFWAMLLGNSTMDSTSANSTGVELHIQETQLLADRFMPGTAASLSLSLETGKNTTLSIGLQNAALPGYAVGATVLSSKITGGDGVVIVNDTYRGALELKPIGPGSAQYTFCYTREDKDATTLNITVTGEGSTPQNVTWALENGVLTIAGSGRVPWGYLQEAPWGNRRLEVREVVIGEGITELLDGLFADHTNLTKVTLPASLKTINFDVFALDSNMTGGAAVEQVHLTDLAAWCGVRFMGATANPFYEGAALYMDGQEVTELRLPDGLTAIGSDVFWGCGSIESLVIPDSVQTIGAYAFAECSRLRTVTLPKGLTEISDSLFSKCSRLTTIELPDTVRYIGSSAFHYCQSLASVRLPQGLTAIGDSAFSSCTALTSITLPEGVTSIAAYTFWNCTALRYIDLPASLQSIADDAFLGTDQTLKHIFFRGTSARWQTISQGNDQLRRPVLHCGVTGEPVYTKDYRVCCAICDALLEEIRVPISMSVYASPSPNSLIYYYRDDPNYVRDPQSNRLKLDGTLRINWSTGPSTYVDMGSSQVTYTGFDVNKAGDQTITIHYMGLTNTEITVRVWAREYSVTFQDWNGTVLFQASYHYGDQVMLPELTPSRPSDGYYSYFFTGWSQELQSVCTGDRTYIARYREVQPSDLFRLRFSMPNGQQLYEIYLHYGDPIDSWMIPSVNAPAGYAFAGWDKAVPETMPPEDLYLVAVLEEQPPAHAHTFGLWQIETESVLNGKPGVKYRQCQCGEKETATYSNPLIDVPNGKYFSKPIFWAYENGITKGKTAAEFQRDVSCTRKQIVTFLWRAAGQPEPKSMKNPFTDVKHDQFEKAILWAYYEGITSGTGDGSTFSPENACTRKQIVTFLWRFYGQPAPESEEIRFTDVKNDRFASAILWAAEQGITTGTGDGSTFSPENTCTRGQIVTFLYRAMAE